MTIDSQPRQADILLDVSLELEKEAAATLRHIIDSDLNTVLANGRSIRQAMVDLTENYNERVQQLIWTKWSHEIPRSETRTLLAQLQGARANFIAYIAELPDSQLTVLGTRESTLDPAGHATGQQVVERAQEEDRAAIQLIANAKNGK